MTRKGEIISFDTTPLIWGVRAESSRGDEHWIAKTARYIKFIRDTNKQILIPAPALSEYLIGASDTELNSLSILKIGAAIGVLDPPSAVLAAQLLRRGRLREIQEDFQLGKSCVKADALIIAISIMNHASKIITHNVTEYRSIADGRITISPVPEIDEQGDWGTLWGDPEG